MKFNLFNLLAGEHGAERKISITAASILVLLVLVTGAVTLSILARQLDTQLQNNLTALLHDRESMIHGAIDTEMSTIEGVLTRPSRLRELLELINAGTAGNEEMREVGVILENFMLTRNAGAIELSDREGKVVSQDGEFIRDAAVSIPLQHPQHTVLLWKSGYFLRLSIPIQLNDSLLGTLTMEVPLPAATSMLQNYSGLGETGEIVMCAALDARRMSCFPSRHRSAGEVLERNIEGMPLPMSYALGGKDGAMTTLDYRRKQVFVAYQALGNSGLGIIVKIDVAELEQPIRKHLLWIVPFFATLIALGFLLLRWQVAPLVREMVSSSRALKQAHDEVQYGFAAMQMTNAELMQAEADKNKQMDALAEANVRMVLFHSVMEELRQFTANLVEVGDQFSYSVLRDAMSLTGAKYGAMGLFDAEGGLKKFLTEGIDETERQKIGSYPTGRGLLHAFYKEGKITRVNCIADDPRSCGFPPGHPPMKSLLGVPLVVNGSTQGIIYLTDKHGGEPFSESDVMVMDMLAGEVVHILVRSELMANLNGSNQALIREKSEQQKLITQLEEAQGHLLQSEKMASIGQLAAGVAHEINNPIGYVYSNLGTLEKYVQDLFAMLGNYEQAESVIADEGIRARLQAARQKLDIGFLKEDLRALMEESKDGITRVKNIVQNLKDFSHVDAADEWQYADLHAGINSTLNIVNNEIKYKAEVVKEYGDIPQVECLPSQLNQVFMNLLVNASHAIEERGIITVRTGQSGEEAWVEVEDTGKGIAPENLQKIFDPFFTTKPIGKGTGLGLSLSYGIMRKHNGRIEVQSVVGRGTKFRVWLPLRHEQKD